jgi:tetratricopeptide (TPR) repeat protein
MAELASEAIELAYRSDDPMDLRNALTVHGFVAMCRGRYEEAIEPYTRALAICRTLGISWQLATSQLNLATALLHTGHAEEAVLRFHEALHLYRDLGDDIFAARALNHLAHAALVRDDVARADGLAREALASLVEQGEPQGVAEALETLAAVAAARSDRDRAITLAAAAASIRDSIASHATPFDAAITRPFMDAMRATTSKEQWGRAWEAGRALDPAGAIECALAGPPRAFGTSTDGASPGPPSGSDPEIPVGEGGSPPAG